MLRVVRVNVRRSGGVLDGQKKGAEMGLDASFSPVLRQLLNSAPLLLGLQLRFLAFVVRLQPSERVLDP